jgi:hypothetical protein
MEITTAARPEAASIEDVVKEAFDRHAKGEPVEDQAKQIWGLLYEQVPKLDYSTTANAIGNGTVQGNPDIIKALSELLVRAGLPDTPETQKLAFPVFWALTKADALESLQKEKSGSLWALNAEKYEAAKAEYYAAFEEKTNKAYALYNLKSALGQKL